MATSKTELINKALTLIGANPVTSIDDDTNNARMINRVYDIALRSILSECKWNFATKRKLLVTVTDTLDWYDTGETYVYQKPVDSVRIFGTNDADAKWREEGDFIISDTAALGVRYVQYVDNPDKYPSSFIDAFSDRLCADISFMVTNALSTAQTFQEKYEKVTLPKARAENSQLGTQQTLKDDAWELAKYGNSSANS
jgi:hypothetical protein